MRKLYELIKRIIGNERGDEQSARMMSVSLNMILLAFFIVLNSIAVMDDQRIRNALGSLIGSFGILPAGQSPLIDSGKGIMPKSSPMMKIEHYQNIILERLKSLAIKSDLGKGFGVDVSGQNIIITLHSEVLFEQGLKIKKDAESLLTELAKLIHKSYKPVVIRGYSDKKGKSMSRTTWGHSASMGLAVLRFFTEQTGIPAKRFSVEGFGNSRPDLNNMVEIFFIEGF